MGKVTAIKVGTNNGEPLIEVVQNDFDGMKKDIGAKYLGISNFVVKGKSYDLYYDDEPTNDKQVEVLVTSPQFIEGMDMRIRNKVFLSKGDNNTGEMVDLTDAEIKEIVKRLNGGYLINPVDGTGVSVVNLHWDK